MRITDITPQKTVAGKKERWVAYGRVSSKSIEQLHSFTAQIRHYTDYFKTRPGCELVDLYMDEGISGTDMYKRDEFLRMIDDCKREKVDKIITKSVSRFARNTEELLNVIRLLKSIGVSVYFEEQNINTEKLNAEMILTFPGMAAQKESETISGNLRWSYKKRMESGEYNCTRTPFGYKWVNGELQINEAEAAIIREIFKLYLQGNGIQKIADILNERKIEKRYGYAEWHKNTILYILNNERYMGDAVLQKKCTTDTFPHKKIKNKGQKPKYYVENSNIPIISREIFEKSKQMRKDKGKASVEIIKYPLSNKIFCSECGSAYRRETKVGQKIFWHCMRTAVGVSHCKSKRLSEDCIYNAFVNVFNTLKAYRTEIIENYMYEINRLNASISDIEDKIKDIDVKVANLSAKNLVITKLYTNGSLSVADYNAKTFEITTKLAELRAERKKLLGEERDRQIVELIELNETIKISPYISDFNEELFNATIDKIIVGSDNLVTFCLVGGLKIKEEV